MTEPDTYGPSFEDHVTMLPSYSETKRTYYGRIVNGRKVYVWFYGGHDVYAAQVADVALRLGVSDDT